MTTKTLSLVFAVLLSLLILPSAGAVGPDIKIKSVGGQCINGAPAIIVTLDSLTWDYYKQTLVIHIPAGSTPARPWPSTNPAIFNVPPGPGTLEVKTAGASSGVQSYNAVTCQPKKGMTWFHMASNAQYGTITVGCGAAGPNRCDAANGDTVCSQQLPVLCIYKPKPAFQLPVGLPVPDQNNRWSGGVVATTLPVAGNTFANSADVSAYCQTRFGTGWRVAEFHDGWGWNFQAYGGTVSAPTVPSTRFWVHINDQPGGNCWQP